MADYPYPAIRGPGQPGHAQHSRGLAEAADFQTPVGVALYVPTTPVDARWVVTVNENLGSGSYGRWVEITGPVRLRFAHLSVSRVSKGQRPEPGQFLGRTGESGDVTGPHLHFEASQDLWKWARRIWEPAKEWDEMATKEEIEAVVRAVVRAENAKFSDVLRAELEKFSEWEVAALARLVLKRELISGYGGDLNDTYEQVIREAISAARSRESKQHPA